MEYTGIFLPIAVVARSKAWVCRCLLRLWVRMPPGAWMCLLWVLYTVRKRSLRRADHSSTGVLPTVVCRSVWSRNVKNEEAMASRWAAAPQKKNKINTAIYVTEQNGCSSCTQLDNVSLATRLDSKNNYCFNLPCCTRYWLNFSTTWTLPTLYIGVVMIYWHYIITIYNWQSYMLMLASLLV